MLAIPFPAIDPVLVEIGPLAVRWYSLAYVAGLVLGLYYAKHLIKHPPHAMSAERMDDFLVWATLGVVLGGRLGYALFYNAPYFLDHPVEVLYVWRGGMSFHGGLLGVLLACVLFARKHKLDMLAVGDVIACAAPIGLFFGRIANFINGELFGRVSDVPWAMVFPHGGPDPRHPSQLYEAALEGLVLFVVLHIMWRIPSIRFRPGILAGAMFLGYGTARAFVELFRQPDAHIGFLAGGITMGQVLSTPVFLVGGLLVFIAFKRGKVS